ncbi:MAG: cysteine desulfurase [Bacteroidetes bacterium SW_11_45_7]|nr:MAG: cysteine desulfurase [Bacteroidetes bacterium SW_11_45_7]
MSIYLDNAATTCIDNQVMEAMLPYLKDCYGNPSSTHSFGRETKAAIEQARKTVAGHFNVTPGEIFFTSGGTESNNTAIKCAVRDFSIDHIISSPIEHHCVLDTVEHLAEQGTITPHYVRILEDGHIDPEHLTELLSSLEGNTLVSLMHANNEIGTVLPLKQVGDICKEYGALFHSDTVQTVAHYPLDLHELNVDMVSGSAHKFHGPKGSGFLYVNKNLKLDAFIHGGGQERSMRSGTENLYGIVGLAKAFDIACHEMNDQNEHILELKQYMADQLHQNVPDIQFNGDIGHDQLCTVLNVSFPKSDQSEMFLLNLDMEGIAASGGSACSSGADAGSHVLNELNVDPHRPSVRFSFSKYNTKEEIDTVVEKIKALYPVAAK